MVRTLIVLLTAVALAGCGAETSAPSSGPTFRHVRLDPALADAGLGAQDVQSLSEVAQLRRYGRRPGQLVSWRDSQDLALLAVRRCRAAGAAGEWSRFVRRDIRRGIGREAAVRTNDYMRQRVCPVVAAHAADGS